VIPEDIARDTLLGGRVAIAQPAEGYRVAVDAVLLAAAVDAEMGERVLDLGCGVGSVSLCLAWRRPGVEIVGLDREPAFLACARANAEANGVAARVTFMEGDVCDPPNVIRAGFDQVMLNPPYLKAGAATVSAHPLKAAATAEGAAATLPDWIACARAALRPGGVVTMIHRADRLADCLAALRGFGGIAVLPIHPKADRAARRILIRARAGSGEPLSILPGFILHEADGRFTAAADAILRDGDALVMA
jgi:tRNA1(Val) A37 N6-methylase TrmN6